MKALLKIGLEALSPAIRGWEHFRFGEISHENFPSPIFIVGAPRTGSTVLYQYLTNYFDFLYVNNLACKLSPHLLFAFSLSQLIYGNKPHGSFGSNFGATKGGNSPSECGAFWYQWLPRDRHFIDFADITPEVVAQVRSAIANPSKVFDKPFLFKNLNAGQRIRLITKSLPNARFVFVKRDPFFTVQSIVSAKQKLGMDLGSFWSIMPSNYDELAKLPWHKQIVGQVYSLERQIHHDLDEFSAPEKHITLTFEELTANRINSQLRAWLPHPKAKCDDSISTRNIVKFEDAQSTLIKQEISQLDWTNYDRPFA